jgi:hypothetical protein
MSDKKKSSTSLQDGVRISSMGLSDLNEAELKDYNRQVRWYHERGIAAPTRLIFEKIINQRV